MNEITFSRVIVTHIGTKWRVILDFDGRGFTTIDLPMGARPQDIVAHVRAWIDSFERQVVNKPTPGKWYWVKINDEWMPAMYDPKACGGWTNTDTWQDFGGEVVEWQEMVPPTTEPPAQESLADALYDEMTRQIAEYKIPNLVTGTGQSPQSADARPSTEAPSS